MDLIDIIIVVPWLVGVFTILRWVVVLLMKQAKKD